MAESSVKSAGPSVVCTVPPSYSESNTRTEEKSTKRMTNVRLLSAVLITALIVGGILGMVYILSNKSRDIDSEDGTGNVEYNIQTVVATFDDNGKEKEGNFRVGHYDDGIVHIDSYMDNFEIVYDYNRNLAVFKNLASSDCFFTNLEDIPVSGMDTDSDTDVWTVLPPLFNAPTSDDIDVMNMTMVTELPNDFVLKATDDKIGLMCTGMRSYWVEISGAHSVPRSKRANCIWVKCTKICADGTTQNGWCKFVRVSRPSPIA